MTDGFDDIPKAGEGVREELNALYESGGMEALLEMLEKLDPQYYERCDRGNRQRVTRALEVCITAQRPYSSFLTGQSRKLNFDVIRILLELPRAELYERIDRRVDVMVAEGLVEEARALHQYAYLNALKTVGYRELFDYFDGKQETADDMVQAHTRISTFLATRERQGNRIHKVLDGVTDIKKDIKKEAR